MTVRLSSAECYIFVIKVTKIIEYGRAISVLAQALEGLSRSLSGNRNDPG